MTGRLASRRVLVTGASSGIGAATAQACTDLGATVALLARRKDRLADVCEACGDRAKAFPADVSDVGAVRRAVDAAAEWMGGIDAVVNNAGVMMLGPFGEGDPDDWRRMVDVNLTGPMFVAHAALPHIRAAGGGDIVNVTSMSTQRAREGRLGSGLSVYAATKAGVHVWSEGLRRELVPDGVRVCVLTPGLVRTELGKDIRDPQLRDVLQSSAEAIGLLPEDVAHEIVHVLGRPAHVRVHELALIPMPQRQTQQPARENPMRDSASG